jgi:TolB-like protein
LHREVLSLLHHHEQAGDTIEDLPGEVATEMLEQAPNQLIPEQRIDHYQIVSLLGVGGMGEVYLAKDDTLRRQVALKLLPLRFTQDPFRVRRFEKEARAASGLNHPNIVTIHQIGEVDGTHFIVTEFIEGRTLRHRMVDGPMSIMEALHIAIQVASALDTAHAAGIVHRDIKPENIMLRPDGLVKVLDFGLAKLAEDDEPAMNSNAFGLSATRTGVGMVMGSVQYMSPEQAQGQRMDASTDTFSLGVVLFEMVTGHAPFTGATIADTLAAILQNAPHPLKQYQSAAPPELERILGNALAKQPGARYATTGHMYRDLTALDQQLKLQAKLGEVLPNLMNRRRAIWLGGTAVAATALSGLVAWKLWPEAATQTLAVLPLAYSGNGRSAEAIAAFISATLIDDLKPMPSLKVTEHSAVSGLMPDKVDLRAVGTQLGVSYLLTGRVTVDEESVSIEAKLVNAATGEVPWESTYAPVPLGDAYRTHEKITSDVIDQPIF